MAATGYKASLTLISRDTNGDVLNSTFNSVNPALMDADSATNVAKMTVINTGMRQANSLTTNTYIDTTYSVYYRLEDVPEST